MGNACCVDNKTIRNEENESEFNNTIGLKSRTGFAQTGDFKDKDNDEGQQKMHTQVKAEILDPNENILPIKNIDEDAMESPEELTPAYIAISEAAHDTDQGLTNFNETDLFHEYNQNYNNEGNVNKNARFTGEDQHEVYEGSWNPETNKFNGYGILTKNNGSKFSGFWLEGVMQGPGRHINKEGDYFEGNFENGLYSGYGSFYHKNGNYYQGEWYNSKMQGNGKEFFNDGCKFEGEYVNGFKQGNGRYEWLDGSYYSGEFYNNQQHGQGEYHWEDGRNYNGTWDNGLMQGQGIYTFVDGSYYEGNFVDNKKHGYGKLCWNENKFYEGNWENGKQHGKGRYIKDGNEIIGIWEDGKFKNKIKE